jgi:hypothetical protein
MPPAQIPAGDLSALTSRGLEGVAASAQERRSVALCPVCNKHPGGIENSP